MQKIQFKLITYFALMSMLLFCRFVWYEVKAAAVRVDSSASYILVSPKAVIPPIISEYFFMFLVLVHFQEQDTLT